MGESRDLYDGWHARVADQAALDTPWHRLVRESLSIERDLDGRRVLEIACGRGDFAASSAPAAPVKEQQVPASRTSRRNRLGMRMCGDPRMGLAIVDD